MEATKQIRLLEACDPVFASLVPHNGTVAFKFDNSQRLFHAVNNDDYGLIWKTNYPATARKCLIIIGLGSLGTAAAAHYLKSNAATIGKMYGRRDFACLIQVKLDQGKESAQICHLSHEPLLWNIMCHPVVWWKHYRHLRNKQFSNHANSPDAQS